MAPDGEESRGNEMESGRGIVPSCLLFSGGGTVAPGTVAPATAESGSVSAHLQAAVGR